MTERLRVLFVEDSEDDALLVLHELRRGGYDPQYERVDTEPALRAALDRQGWDVVLSDFSMPVFNGLAAFEILRQTGLDIPFIFVSGRIGEDRAAEAMRRGAADYILKDNLNRLTPAIRRELQDAVARREALKVRLALVESEHRLSSIYDTVGAVIFQLAVEPNGAFRFSSLNQAFTKVTGVPVEQVLGKTVDEIIPAPSLSLVLAKYREAIETRNIVRWEEISDYPTGRLTGEVSVAPIFDEAGHCTHLVGAVHDITQRKRAEEELRTSQRLLQTVFDTLPLTLAVKDTESRYQMVNRAWCERYGVVPADVVGVHSLDVPGRPEQEKRNTLAEDRKVLDGNGSPVVFEGWDTTGAGEVRHYQSIKAAIRDENGKATGLISATVDFTAQKRAEAELQASQRLLQTVFDTIPHHLIVKDRESRYLMVNKAWCEAFGRTPEEVLHRSTLEQSARPPQEIARVLEEDRRVFSGESFLIPMQRTLTVKNGEKRYFQGIKAPLRDGSGATVGLVAISMDVTPEVEAQQKADTAHARLFDAIESLPAAFMMYDPDERLLLWNSRCGEFYPETFARFHRGMAFEEVARMNAQTRLADVEGLEEWVRERLDQFRNRPGTFEREQKDGSWIQGIDRRTSDGSTVCQRFDVTEIKQREAELRQSQKLEAIGSLAGGIAHDFNNLLTVIGSYAGFIQDAAEGLDAIRDDARVIRETSDRAAALTRQLLAFSRRQVLLLRPLDINRTVGNIEKMLQRLIGENIELRTSMQPALQWIQADESQIEQIILNLAVNARDAMPRGGKLLIETANRPLDAAYSSTHAEATPGDYVMLAVTDTGHGMSAEVQKRVFEPFFTTKPLGEGTGMGLATVYGIVKQMKGFVYVYSEPGRGTSFKIYFPQTSVEAAVGASPVEAAAPTAATETVLLVEDEELVRRSAVRILRSAGYVVLHASDAQDALAICASHPEMIDLLLTDVVMPQLSGRELWDQVRAVRPMRVLFMSGYTDDAVVRHGILEGGVPFLNKPFTKQTLLAKVREVLAGPLPNGGAAA